MTNNGPVTTSAAEALQSFERLAVDAAAKMADAATEFAWAVYQIVENGLWREHVDDDGNQVFTRLNDYLRYLDQQCLRSRSAMWDDIRAMRLAGAYGYQDYDSIAERGVSIFKKIVRSVDVDRKTHKVVGQPDEEVRAAIEELSSRPSSANSGLTPTDIHEQLESRFQLSGIWIEENSDGTMSWFKREFVDGYAVLKVGEVRIELTDGPPQEVMQFVRKKLRGR